MKKILFTILVVSCCGFSGIFAQNAANELPQTSELPSEGEAKSFHELDGVYAYELFDKYGKLISSGTSKLVETTKLKPGSYLIRYNGKTEMIKKKEE